MKKDLEIGKIYSIHHRKKGHFVAQLLEVVPAWGGDEADEVFLTMKYDTRAGTDQVGLAIAPGKSKVRVSNLRPSHILSIKETEKGEWLRTARVPEEEKVGKSDPGLVDKVRAFLRR